MDDLKEILHCPRCGRQHVDGRWWAHKAHIRHNCMFKGCGHIWDEDHASIGVRMVPA